MAIAQRGWIAYYPPPCVGSNGEREAILSVMVMMHFEWVADDNGRREHPLGYGHDAKGTAKKECGAGVLW